MEKAVKRSRSKMVTDLKASLQLMRTEGRNHDSVVNSLYYPDTRLSPLIESLRVHVAKIDGSTVSEKERSGAGKILEQVAFLAFQGLLGEPSIQSFASAGPQLDLLATSVDDGWLHVCEMVYVTTQVRGILVECKARKAPVNDQDFSRLCAIAQHMDTTVGMGVFFSLRGATGFPEKGKPSRKLHAARLRQVLFHSKHSIPVLVLSWADIQQLTEPGALVRILAAKVEDLVNMPIHARPKPCAPVPLPDHLRALSD